MMERVVWKQTATWTMRAGGWALTAAAVGIIVLTLAAAGPTLMGHKTFIVLGGSMGPAIPIGAAVVVEEVPPSRLQRGDVITYVARSKILLTHRIVDVVVDQYGLGFRTKGDANTAPDAELVRPPNILGRVWYTVPLAGYILHYGNQTRTKLAVLALGVGLMVMQFLPGELRRLVASVFRKIPETRAAPGRGEDASMAAQLQGEQSGAPSPQNSGSST